MSGQGKLKNVQVTHRVLSRSVDHVEILGTFYLDGEGW